MASLISLHHADAGQQRDTAEKPEYTLGVYPALSISQLEKMFSPIALEIGQGIGRNILFQTASTYEKFSGRLDRAEFDIALVHPFDYVRHAEKAGYIAVARKNEELTAIFVVPLESPVKTFKDLKGRTIAMPPIGSAVGILAETELTKQGFKQNKDISVRHFGEHDSSLQNVAIKNADAAATCRAVLRIYETSLQTKFRIIGETTSIPHSIFVVHKRVPKKEHDLIRNILLNTTLSGVPENLRKAFVIEGKKPFIEISDGDIKRLRAKYILQKGKL